MWTQIAEEQAQLQAIDQKPPGWTAGKKVRAQSEQQVARGKASISESCLAWLTTLFELHNQASSPLPCGCSLSTVRSTPWVLAAANFPESALLA
jgi:hypothetical protein